ncbi:MAG: glycoside hydrolase family 97 protein, partial [Bacteroidales bacterium]|nr:glycoside hydrolase family 97 protein [Bacteroidales bacterium]
MKTIIKSVFAGFCLPVFFLNSCIGDANQTYFSVQSPDSTLNVNVYVGRTIKYTLSHKGDALLNKSPVSLSLSDGSSFGIDAVLENFSTKSVNQLIDAVVYKRSKIVDNYNELTLSFKDGFDIIFRAYNDGIAYRFVSKREQPFTVKSEQAVFHFPSGEWTSFVPYVLDPKFSLEEQFHNSFENTYRHIRLSEWDRRRLAFLPLLVEAPGGKKVCITEADLGNYPGMYLCNGSTFGALRGVFAPCPKETKQGGYNNLQSLVVSTESFLAKAEGNTHFPWRVIIVAEKDSELADSDMVYRLSEPCRLADVSWIKSGKVAWDWWNDWNLKGVDFVSGINNDTYKYYIDFASNNGIEYVILDEGWAVKHLADLFQVVPEINLEELVAYATERHVGLILWAGYYAFNRDIENICKHYSEMGIKGFKVDFMERDDYLMTTFLYQAAEIAAKYHLLLDYHGVFKPAGLNRTFPNVVNFEGVHGLEQMKWAVDADQVTYDVTIPFVRMVAGPMDYTPGAMRNATKDNYRAVNSEPMSQGTRCRQLAEYIVFESPLNMLCDSPSNYMREKECTDFIAAVPTVWDNTIALDGKIAEYVVIARQKGNEWYVGGMIDWSARTLYIDLSFLGDGSFRAELFKDGINANRNASDYTKEIINIPDNRKMKIEMAAGGGFAMKIMAN